MQTRTRAISLTAVFLGTACVVAAQPQVAIGGYLANLGYPNQITVGPDGALWYTSPQANSIGRMTVAGTNPRVYSVPTAYSEVGAIVAGPDMALWFVEPGGNKIGRIGLAGNITDYEIPTPNSSPGGIVRAQDGKLWFTETAAKKIGSITTGGVITEYSVDSSGGPASITIGADGALWFTESVSNAIGQLTALGSFHEYQVPKLGGNPSSLGAITSGPDGALWFIESNQGVIGRITTGGLVTQYSIPVFQAGPSGITTGPDGALWFCLPYSRLIGRVTTDGVFTTYLVPESLPSDGGPSPSAIVSGPDGSLWFTENLSGMIGQVVFTTATLSADLASATCLSQITFSGSNFGPGEQVSVYAYGFGSASLAEAVADSTGSFSSISFVPPGNAGQRLFLARGAQSGRQGAASFVEKPRVLLAQQSGAPGAMVAAFGCGYFPSNNFNVKWRSGSNESILLGSTASDSAGNLFDANAFHFSVPLDAPPGTYIVEVIGVDLGSVELSVAPFTVN